MTSGQLFWSLTLSGKCKLFPLLCKLHNIKIKWNKWLWERLVSCTTQSVWRTQLEGRALGSCIDCEMEVGWKNLFSLPLTCLYGLNSEVTFVGWGCSFILFFCLFINKVNRVKWFTWYHLAYISDCAKQNSEFTWAGYIISHHYHQWGLLINSVKPEIVFYALLKNLSGSLTYIPVFKQQLF